MPIATSLTGAEQFPIDTELAAGAAPQSAAINTLQLAAYMNLLASNASITTVAGTRYFSQINLGVPQLLNGIQVLTGSVGGTDNWIVELHSASGALLATSALAGIVAGAAGQWKQYAFTAQYQTTAGGIYFLAVQSNGTTAKIGAYNAPSLPINTGSAAGTFGTSAAITPPTSYTAGVGPIALVY